MPRNFTNSFPHPPLTVQALKQFSTAVPPREQNLESVACSAALRALFALVVCRKTMSAVSKAASESSGTDRNCTWKSAVVAALAAEKPDHSQKLPSAHRSKFKDTIVSDGLASRHATQGHRRKAPRRWAQKRRLQR